MCGPGPLARIKEKHMASALKRTALPEPPSPDMVATMAQALRFSLAALADNRAGRLAPEQAAALRRRALRRLLLGAAIVAGALLLAAAVGVAEGAQILGQMLLFSGIVAL